ncbi:MAG: GntR family transcriptional regulator [Neomegalonema sp.]|nr:GntR family transcriptional regulator [Neomegalonema sp.]
MSRHVPKQDDASVFTALLDAIDHGEFPPGSRLIETELAERFQVSRTPIREALNRLESIGVATRDGRRGVTVAMLDHDQLGELYDLREVLEGFAARLAARRASPPEIAVLRELVTTDAELAANDAPTQELALANKRFHRLLHQASHNRYLLDMLDRMRRSLALLSGTSLAAPGRSVDSVDEHDAIVSAIEARDEASAEAAARRHIVNAYKTRLRQGIDKPR